MDQINWNEALTPVIEKLNTWYDAGLAMLPNLIVACVVLGLFWFLGRVTRKVMLRVVSRFNDNSALTRLAATLAGVTILSLGIFVGLNVLQLEKTVTSLLAGAGLLGLALGLAVQSLASNLLAGLIIAVRKPFALGDTIRTQNHFGSVQSITLRATRIMTFEGQEVVIPNSEVVDHPVKNYTHSGWRRIDVNVGVSYGDEIDHAIETVHSALNSLDLPSVSNREHEVVVTGFGASSVDLSARFYLDTAGGVAYPQAKSQIAVAIKHALDEADISIPFPITTLDFGIRGGRSAEEALVLPFAKKFSDAASGSNKAGDPAAQSA